jgi:GLPGLI family protein
MKNQIRLFVLLIALLPLVNTAVGQKKAKPFEGVVTYTLSTEGRELDAQEKAQMPTEMKIFYKGNKTRMEQLTAMGNFVTISDGDDKTNMVLLDLMGQKIVLKSTKEDLEKTLKEAPETKINVTTETKTIAGYNCKKAEVIQGEKTNYVYFTDEIKVADPNWNTQYKDIKGIMMEYSQPTQDEQLTLKLTVKEVKKQKIKPDMFTVPEGYTEMKPEELKSLFGG